MNQDEARKLIGGYATGSLTDSERKALFAAALDDQALFDELADEQSLKALLDEPGVRDRLLAGLAPKVETRRWTWAWVGIASALAGCAALAVLWLNVPNQQGANEVTAKVELPSPLKTPGPRRFDEKDSATLAPSAAPSQVAAPPKAKAPENNQAKASEPVGALKSTPAATSIPNDTFARDTVKVSAEAPKAEKDVAATAPTPAPSVFEAVVPQAQRARVAPAKPAAVAAPAATAAPPPTAPAQALLDTGQNPVLQKNAATGTVGGFGAGGGGRAGFVQQQTFGFRYQVNETILQVTPTSIGWLTVTTADVPPVTLFSNRMVPSGAPLAIPVPADAKELTIQFSATSGPVSEAPQRRTTLNGVVAGDSAVAITVAAHP